jgi:hypothetical protein
VLGWQEATSEFAVAEAERDNLREELNEVKLEIKMLQEACDHLVSEVNGLVLGWLWAVNGTCTLSQCRGRGESALCQSCS